MTISAGPAAAFDADVLIVGAGPVGLSLAIELGLQGRRCLLAERQSRDGLAPRAKTTNVRSRELLRRWGIAGQLAAAAPFGVDYPSNAVFATRLAGRELARFANAFYCAPQRDDRFAEHAQWIPQYKVEAVLRERALACPGVALDLGVALEDFTQDAQGVTARLCSTAPGAQPRSVRARYLVGADGARSTVRERLGIEMQGTSPLGHFHNIVFRSPGLSQRHALGPAVMYWLVNPQVPSVVAPLDVGDVWTFGCPLLGDAQADPVPLIRTALGLPDAPVEILGRDVWTAHQLLATLAILVVLMIGASIASADFLTGPNVSNVSRQVVGVGVMALGMLLVVLTGGIDLSVGSVAALSSVVTAMLVPQHGLAVALAAGLAAGAVCGLVNGALISMYRLSPFVVTLSMMTVARGVALIVSNGAPILVGEEGQALLDFGRDTWLGLPQPTLLMLAVFALGAVFLGLTRAGRIVRAIGSNEEAVRLSGVPVARHVMLTYVVSGLLAGLAGIISTARAGVGAPTVGVGDELTVIAAVVIGGASLAGGRGTVLNTLVGVLILGVIANVMNLTSVPGYHQQVVMGLIILVAIVAQRSAGASQR